MNLANLTEVFFGNLPIACAKALYLPQEVNELELFAKVEFPALGLF